MRIARHPRHLARVLVVGTLLIASRAAAQPLAIPARLDDSTFWRMVTEMSEPGGYFRSDNFVSNEWSLQYVIPHLQKATTPNGVYLGVAPDQNFTYIVGLRPRIAFIVDIRRQNLIQHLMYKALIETSADRADFLAKLFGRPRPRGLDTATTLEALFGAYAAAAPDSVLYRRTLDGMKDQLVRRHGFALTPDDLQSLEYVYKAFYTAGPELTYNFPSFNRGYGGMRGMPIYAQMLLENDGQGVNRSYLATEANYRALK